MATRLVLVSTVLAVVSIVVCMDPLHLFDSSGSGRDAAAGGGAAFDLELVPLDGAAGPESLVFDARGGGPYTGVSDGRILQWQGRGRGWRQFAVSAPHVRRELCDRSRYGSSKEHVCGRPLGLQFNHKTGELYVADAYLGLLSVAAGGNHTNVVATEARGVPFRFTNGVDVDQETGAVYFTDSSARFQRREFILATIAGDKTGRLMRYDPATGELRVLLDELSFPNGVALSRDGAFLLVVETIPCRVLRYWLRTPRAGAVEVFRDLPGFPDNIKRSPRGGFWVALHSKRSRSLQWVLPLPWLGEALRSWVPVDVERLSCWFLKWTAPAPALRLGEEGEVLEVAGGMGGGKLRFISEIEEREGRLWMGSVVMPHVGVYNTKD